MKTCVLILTTLFAMHGNTQIGINLTGSNLDISGSVQQLELTESVTAHSMLNFDITNSSGSILDLIVTRKVISEPTDWSNFLCWGPAPFGTCYPPNDLDIWSTTTEAIVDTAKLSTYLSAPTYGSAHYRYYVSEDGINFIDSVDISVNSVASLELSSLISVKVFPNPSTNYATIESALPYNYTVFNSGGLMILDGSAIQTTTKLDVSELPSGSYYLIIRSENEAITKQLQVR